MGSAWASPIPVSIGCEVMAASAGSGNFLLVPGHSRRRRSRLMRDRWGREEAEEEAKENEEENGDGPLKPN